MKTDLKKYPFGSPSADYCREHGYDKLTEIPDDISNGVLLTGILGAADALFHELLTIRKLLEERS